MQVQLARIEERASRLQSQLTRQNERAARLKAEIKFAQKCDAAVPLREVASMLHISLQTAWRMVRLGQLKGFRSSPRRGHWFVTKRSIAQLHEKIISQSVRRQGTNTAT
ncbi:MAG: helix-turn-helix domain-containing protein [Terriglobales bacterium]